MAGPAIADRNFSAAAPKCPLYPKAVPKALGVQLYLFAIRRSFEPLIATQPALAPAVIDYLVSATPAHQERGPPPLPSLA